jgi:hypothetical protein
MATKPTDATRPYALIKAMAANKKPYLVMALRQDMAKAYGLSKEPNDKVLMQDLKQVEEKLANNHALTLKERFMVQYVVTQDCLYQMRQDGEDLSCDMKAVDKLTTADFKQAKDKQQSQQQQDRKVVDIRDRLPKSANAASVNAQRQQSAANAQSQQRAQTHQTAGVGTEEDLDRVHSVRQFEVVLTDFLDLYHQLMDYKTQLIRHEEDKLRLMREYNISEGQLENMYARNNPAQGLRPAAGMEKVIGRQAEFLQRLKVIELNREALIVHIRQQIEDIERFYHSNLTKEDKLQLKATLEQATLGPAPQLQLSNVLRLSLSPAPRPGKKQEESYQPRPRPGTPRPSI